MLLFPPVCLSVCVSQRSRGFLWRWNGDTGASMAPAQLSVISSWFSSHCFTHLAPVALTWTRDWQEENFQLSWRFASARQPAISGILMAAFMCEWACVRAHCRVWFNRKPSMRVLYHQSNHQFPRRFCETCVGPKCLLLYFPARVHILSNFVHSCIRTPVYLTVCQRHFTLTWVNLDAELTVINQRAAEGE